MVSAHEVIMYSARMKNNFPKAGRGMFESLDELAREPGRASWRTANLNGLRRDLIPGCSWGQHPRGVGSISSWLRQHMANGQAQGQTLMNRLHGEQSIWSGLLVMAVSGREFPWKLPADREGRCVTPEVDPAEPPLQLYSVRSPDLQCLQDLGSIPILVMVRTEAQRSR